LLPNSVSKPISRCESSKVSSELQFDGFDHLVDALGIAATRQKSRLRKHITTVFGGLLSSKIFLCLFEALLSTSELIAITNQALERVAKFQIFTPLSQEAHDLILTWVGMVELADHAKDLLRNLLRAPSFTTSRVISTTVEKTNIYEVFSAKQMTEIAELFVKFWQEEKPFFVFLQQQMLRSEMIQSLFEKMYDHNQAGRRIWIRMAEDGTILGFAIWHTQNFSGPSLAKVAKGVTFPKSVAKKIKDYLQRTETLMAGGAQNTFHLEQLCVSKDHRKQGFGLALLQPMIQTAEVNRTPISTLVHFESLVPFYEKLGFREDGISDGFPKLFIRLLSPPAAKKTL